MSTPTTDDIRSQIGSGWHAPYRAALVRRFDRWLAANENDTAHAVALERERIAAYLESERWNNGDPTEPSRETSIAAADAIRSGWHWKDGA